MPFDSAAIKAGRECTYETHGPEDDAVHNKPGLFTKPSDLLLLGKAHVFGKWSKHIFHGGGAQAGQDDNHQEHEVDVIKSSAILVRPVVVLLQSKEFRGVGLGSRQEVVGAEQQGQQVEGETWMSCVSAMALQV